MPPPQPRGPGRAGHPSRVSTGAGVTRGAGVAPQRRGGTAFWGQEATIPAVAPPGRPCHTGSEVGTDRDLSHRECGGGIPGMLLSRRECGGDTPGMLLSRRDLCTSLNSLEIAFWLCAAKLVSVVTKTHKPWEKVASSKDKKK